jgi:CubicO group peptidase (beta-lactamase class C family)
VISRFGGADGPGWSAPADGELSEHFTDRFLGPEIARTMVTDLSHIAARLREELVVTQDDPLQARVRVGGIGFEAEAEAESPHRLRDFRAYPVGSRVTDARVAAPPISSSGAVPAAAAEAAARGFAELGLAGVVLAGGAPDGADWGIARGWADLDRAEPLRPGHRFPAYGVTRLITAAAVLRLAAEGRVRLDEPASWPHDDPDAVTGYELEPDGTFVPDLDDVATMPAAAGLWTTAADLVTFGTRWSSLLPDALAGEALRPHAAEETCPGQAGLGWRLNTARGFAFQVGVGPGGSSSLIIKPGVGRAYVAPTNRKVNVAPLKRQGLPAELLGPPRPAGAVC